MYNKGRVIKLPSGSDSQAALATQLMSVSCFAHLTVNRVNGTWWTLEISDLFGMHNAGLQQLFSCLALSTTLYYSQLPRKVPASACLHEEDDCSAGTTELTVSLTVLPPQRRRAGCISPYSQSCLWYLNLVTCAQRYNLLMGGKNVKFSVEVVLFRDSEWWFNVNTFLCVEEGLSLNNWSLVMNKSDTWMQCGCSSLGCGHAWWHHVTEWAEGVSLTPLLSHGRTISWGGWEIFSVPISLHQRQREVSMPGSSVRACVRAEERICSSFPTSHFPFWGLLHWEEGKLGYCHSNHTYLAHRHLSGWKGSDESFISPLTG